LQKRKVLSLEWKSEGVMDDESGESMEPMEEVPLIQLGEAELERLVGWINTGLIKRLLLTNFNSKLLASYFGPSLNSHKTTHESSVEVRETRRYAALHFFHSFIANMCDA